MPRLIQTQRLTKSPIRASLSKDLQLLPSKYRGSLHELNFPCSRKRTEISEAPKQEEKFLYKQTKIVEILIIHAEEIGQMPSNFNPRKNIENPSCESYKENTEEPKFQQENLPDRLADYSIADESCRFSQTSIANLSKVSSITEILHTNDCTIRSGKHKRRSFQGLIYLTNS